MSRASCHILDLLMLASGYEGQSNAIMEAMSAGVPVVASDIPGNRDLVASGETGYLVEVGDRAALAQKALMILADRRPWRKNSAPRAANEC